MVPSSSTNQSLKITFVTNRCDRELFSDATALTERGHEVVCIVPARQIDQIPESDVVVGFGQETILAVLESGRGRPAHFCREYEGDRTEGYDALATIEAAYRTPGITHIAGSRTLADRLGHLFGVNPLAVPFGFEHTAFRLHAEVRRQPKPLRVGISGSFESTERGVATGIAACRVAARRGLELVLVRIGQGSVSQRERDAWGCLTTEWHDSPNADERNVILAGLDIFIGPDLRGARPLDVLEAMASGVPCIVANTAELREVAGRAAELVTPGDHEAIAAAIVALAGSSERRALLAGRGLRAAESFVSDKRIDSLEKVLRTLASGVTGATDAWSNGKWDDSARLHSHLIHQVARSRKVGDYTAAITRASAAVEMYPGSAECTTQLALSLFAAGRTDASIAAAEHALEHAPHSPALHSFLGTAYTELGDPRAARKSFTAAIKNGVAGARPHLEIARTLVREGKIDEALATVERASALDENDRDSSELRSQILAMRQGLM